MDRISFIKYKDDDTVSLDNKVIWAINTFAKKFDYFWIIRDRLGFILDEIIDDLNSCMQRGDDFIILNTIDNSKYNCIKRYINNPKDLFLEQFCEMTVLGNVIFKSKTLFEILRTVPLTDKTYTLWLGVAPFYYIANYNIFSATAITKPCFIFSKEAIEKPSFWVRNYEAQWIIQFYNIMNSLPYIYGDIVPYVIQEWNEVFHLLSLEAIDWHCKTGGISLKTILELKKNIEFVSILPYNEWIRIAKKKFREMNFSSLATLKLKKKFPSYRMLKAYGLIGKKAVFVSVCPTTLLKLYVKYKNYFVVSNMRKIIYKIYKWR